MLNLSRDPDIDTFFLRLGSYRLQSGSIRHHTDLIKNYIGNDLSLFDAVYTIDQLDQLAMDISARVGRPITFQRLQTGGPAVTLDMLSPKAFQSLMVYLKPEYELLKDYYKPPAYREA